MIALITGPVRSGKSARALHVARGLDVPLTYVATARIDPQDREMVDRVARHRLQRGALPAIELWQPGMPALPQIVATAPAQTTLLVDSLGTWTAGYLLDIEALAQSDAPRALTQLETFSEPLLDALMITRAHVILVGEETGWGLVPPSALGRIFRDHLGRLMQRIALVADRIELIIAGYAIDLKATGVPIAEA